MEARSGIGWERKGVLELGLRAVNKQKCNKTRISRQSVQSSQSVRSMEGLSPPSEVPDDVVHALQPENHVLQSTAVLRVLVHGIGDGAACQVKQTKRAGGRARLPARWRRRVLAEGRHQPAMCRRPCDTRPAKAPPCGCCSIIVDSLVIMISLVRCRDGDSPPAEIRPGSWVAACSAWYYSSVDCCRARVAFA